MSAQNFAIIGSVLVSALGAVFGLYQARKADKSATTTKTIELGVTQLVDQYRETNEDLRTRYATLEANFNALTEKVEHLEDLLSERDAEIRLLKKKVEHHHG